MPLPLVARVPSYARALCSLDEDEPSFSDESLPKVAGFTLTKHLGSGASCSDVFEASRTGDKAAVAIKLLAASTSPNLAACSLPRFMREAELTCELSGHPNLCHGESWGACKESGDYYLAMRLLRGQTLGQLLQDSGRVDWRTASQLALDVAKALSHLYAHGVVHRDGVRQG